jgi:hypothetical protein
MARRSKWGRAIDKDRQRVYRSERQAFGGWWQPSGYKFESLRLPGGFADAHALIERMKADPAVIEKFAGAGGISRRMLANVKTLKGRGSGANARKVGAQITIRLGGGKAGQGNAYVAIHEFAHAAVYVKHGTSVNGVQGHGKRWRSAYLWLLERFAGREVAEALARAFDSPPVMGRRKRVHMAGGGSYSLPGNADRPSGGTPLAYNWQPTRANRPNEKPLGPSKPHKPSTPAPKPADGGWAPNDQMTLFPASA